jgi:hypothetical protein
VKQLEQKEPRIMENLRMNWQKSVVCALAAVLVVVFGCGGPSTPKTVKVTGTVTLNGNPVPNASVAFIPENGRAASGRTDAQGKFTLSTFGTNDGALPGPHKVAVTPAPSDEPPPMPGMPGYEESQAAKAPFPAKYGDVKTSGFTANVEPGAKNDFTFDMQGE